MAEMFGRYRLDDRLGQGGMGVVYRAWDPVLERVVALKMVLPTRDVGRDMRDRFLREARAAAQLTHRNIVTIYDLGEQDGQPYLAMEFLDGEDLQRRLARTEKTSLWRKIDIAIEICHGMEFAHAHGVIHRDLKPANIFITGSGGVKIVDFGLARLMSSQLTDSNMLMGTFNYMSPEQVRGERADQQSDIFSIGVVLYELFGGRRAFEGDSAASTLYKILQEVPEPLWKIDAALPRELTAIVEHALAKLRDERYPDIASLRHDLETVRTMSHLAGPATPWPTSAAPSISPYGDMTVPGQRTPTPAPAFPPTPTPVSAPPLTAPGPARGFGAGATIAVVALAIALVAVWTANRRSESSPTAAAPQPAPATPQTLPPRGTEPVTPRPPLPPAESAASPTRTAEADTPARRKPQTAVATEKANPRKRETSVSPSLHQPPDPARGQPVEPKPADPKTTEPKPVETKPAETSATPPPTAPREAAPPPAAQATAPTPGSPPPAATPSSTAPSVALSHPAVPAAETAALTTERANELLRRYKAALEAKNLEQLKRIWPALGGREESRLQDEFKQAADIIVQISDTQVSASGSTGRITFVRGYNIVTVDGQRLSKQVRQAIMDVHRSGDVWLIDTIRFIAR